MGRPKYFIMLFLFSAVIFALATCGIWLNGESLIWESDGLSLYYNFFLFEGEMLRHVISTIGTPDFAIPLYSMNIGYGADILATMGGCLNDPLNLVAVFFGPGTAEIAFEALIFVRFYLAAVAFSAYCFGHGRGTAATLCGSICYALCGFMILWGVLRNPNFVNFGILLPLVLFGTDRVFERKSPVLLVASMALLFFFSAYFSYMMLIILFGYCLLKYFTRDAPRSFSGLIKLFLKFVLFLSLSALLAGIALVPLVDALRSIGRVGLTREIPMFQSVPFYLQLGANLVGGRYSSGSLVLGAVPVVGVIVFYSTRELFSKDVWLPWAWGFALCLIGGLLPWVGSAMNGFGYSSDRWLLVLAFCASYMTTLVFPQFRRMKKGSYMRITAVVIVLAAWICGYAVYSPALQTIVGAVCFCTVSLLVLFFAFRTKFKVAQATLLLCAFILPSITFFIYCSPAGNNYQAQFVPRGEAYTKSHAVFGTGFSKEIRPDYRIDRLLNYQSKNSSFVMGFKGVDFYSSFYNQAVDDMHSDLAVSSDWTNYIFNGLDSRFMLENLLGVKYFIADSENKLDVPYLYEKIDATAGRGSDTTLSLYESAYALPIAFTYEAAITEMDFRQLSFLRRQEVLTKACVLPDASLAKGQSEENLPSSLIEQAVKMVPGEGVSIDDKVLKVSKADATLDIKVSGASEAENYVVFDNLTFSGMPPSERLASSSTSSRDSSKTSLWKDVMWTPDTNCTISVKGGDRVTSFKVGNSAHVNYGGKTDWAVCVGYSKEPVKTYRIKFDRPGYYSFNDIYVASQPVESAVDDLRVLNESNEADITFGVNTIGVHEKAAEGSGAADRYLFISVPFSRGWSATMDGEPVEIQRANIGFMGIITDGKAHDIKFEYCTPGLRLGALCSLLGLLGLLAIIVGRRTMVR